MAFWKKDTEEEFLEREDGLTDYDVYVMSGKEKVIYILLAAGGLFLLGYVFYKSVVLALLLSLFSLKYPQMRTKQIIEKRKQALNVQFKDMLYAVASALGAGKSIESAFRESLRDLAILYPDPETDIIKEVSIIARGIEMNETIEKLLQDFADRSHIEDIENFADIFVACKRSGGNLVEMVRTTSSVISDKIEIKREIETLLTAKKYEQKILNVMPIFLIIALTYTSPDYMEPIFTTIVGRIVMTVALAFFGLAYFIGNKITNIEV